MKLEKLDNDHVRDLLINDLQGKKISQSDNVNEKRIVTLISNKDWKTLSKELKKFYGDDFGVHSSLEQILIKKFSYHFNSQILKKLEGNVNQLLSAFSEKSYLALKKDNFYYCFFARDKVEQTFIEPFLSGKKQTYDLYLVKLDLETKTTSFNGSNKQYRTFENIATKTVTLSDIHDAAKFDDFNLSTDFINILVREGIFLTNFLFNSKDLRIQIKDKNDIGIEPDSFVDTTVILRDQKSLLDLKKVSFIREIDGTGFTIRQNCDNEKTIFTLDFLSGTNKKAKGEIQDVVKKIGVEYEKSILLPTDYLVDKLLSTNAQYRKKYYLPLKEKNGIIIKNLSEKKILSENEKYVVEIDKDQVTTAVSKNLKKHINKFSSKINLNQLRILDVKKEDREIKFNYELLTSDSIPSRKRKGIIPIYTRPDKFKKYHATTLERYNLGKLIISKEIELLDYLLKEILYHEKYLRPGFLWKQFRESLRVLGNYLSNPKKFNEENDQKKMGYFVQKHASILIRRLVGNYEIQEGTSIPDDIINIQGQSFLLDYKMQAELERNEIRKQKDYLEKNKKINPKSTSVIVYSRNLLKSLNEKARKDLFPNNHCIALSLDFIQSLCELYFEYSDSIENLPVENRFQNIIFSALNDQGLIKKEEVEAREDKLLTKIKKEFRKMEL